MSIEVQLPDIGDFKEVAVIEVLVAPGQSILHEQSIITVESDKATMEIPAPADGVVGEIRIKVGDKVSQGSVLLTMEPARAAAAAPAVASAAQAKPAMTAGTPGAPSVASAVQVSAPPAASAAKASAPGVGAAAGAAPKADIECAMLVLGSGPGGYSAAFRAADLGLATVLVERYPVLGGVCLNVGCIPSKALLHVAGVIDEAAHLSAHGVEFAPPKINVEQLRGWKNQVVGKLTGGLAAMAKMRKVNVVHGNGQFIDSHHMQVDTASGRKVIRFDQAIIAAGSQPSRLGFIPEDPRIIDSTGALELSSVPKRMLVIGGGIIGLEMGTVYSTLGARLDVVEMLDGLMPGADRDLVAVWQKYNAHRFDQIMLKTRTTAVDVVSEGIRVSFEGPGAPAPQVYDRVLVAAGRTPNGRGIGAELAGVAVSERGFIAVDSQMRTNIAHIFAIGDIVGQPMLAHKAVHEGHVAAEAATGLKSHFDARVIPSVAYTDPEIAWVGVTEDQARAQGLHYSAAKFPWAASGRAIANGRDEGFTKLLFEEGTHRVIGGAIVGTGAGDLIAEVALAIEMGADAVDIGRTIHPHPTVSESVGMAAELYEGVCTDLPPKKR